MKELLEDAINQIEYMRTQMTPAKRRFTAPSSEKFIGEVRAALPKIDTIRDALARVEWAGDAHDEDGDRYGCCPECEGGDPSHPYTPVIDAGHTPDCKLAAAIKAAGVRA